MRYEAFFLALPVVATLFNILFAVFFCLPHQTRAQPAIHLQGGGVDRCVDVTGEHCKSGLLDRVLSDDEKVAEAGGIEQQQDDEEEEEDEEDPMLAKMPDYDFKAYVRADISSFYREEPGSRVEHEPAFQGQAAKFVNISPDPLQLYWVGDDGPVDNAVIAPWSSGGPASHPTHKFIFAKPGKPNEIVCKFIIKKGTSVYYCDPFTANNKKDEGRGKYEGELRNLDSLSEKDRAHYDAHVFNLKFGEAYKNFTGGSEWLSMYPRNPPRHKIWRADYFGQEHVVATNETHFVRIPENMPTQLSPAEMGRDYDPMSEYRKPGMMNMTIKALSCAPRAFEIRNFLSEEEADHILDVVKNLNLRRSSVGNDSGGQQSSVRTSRNTWVARKSDPILNAVFRRGAHALRINEALLRNRLPGEIDEEREKVLNRRAINEEIQMVHYDVGQQYTAHHDFSFPSAHRQPDSPTRSINLCMYLNDTPKGGQTSFPRWRNGETSKSIDVTPEKGKAVIFYMTNPDGNLDDLTHHAALPVIEGEKWFANLWIHDPVRL